MPRADRGGLTEGQEQRKDEKQKEPSPWVALFVINHGVALLQNLYYTKRYTDN